MGTLPAGTGPNAVAVDPAGRFLDVTNQGSNNVSAFSINATTGALTSAGAPFAAGTGPQSITVDPSGQFVYVANQTSNDVSVYTLNPISGALSPITGSPFMAGTNPVSVATTGTIQ